MITIFSCKKSSPMNLNQYQYCTVYAVHAFFSSANSSAKKNILKQMSGVRETLECFYFETGRGRFTNIYVSDIFHR